MSDTYRYKLEMDDDVAVVPLRHNATNLLRAEYSGELIVDDTVPHTPDESNILMPVNASEDAYTPPQTIV